MLFMGTIIVTVVITKKRLPPCHWIISGDIIQRLKEFIAVVVVTVFSVEVSAVVPTFNYDICYMLQ